MFTPNCGLHHSLANKTVVQIRPKSTSGKWFLLEYTRYPGLSYSGMIHPQILLFGVLSELINSFAQLRLKFVCFMQHKKFGCTMDLVRWPVTVIPRVFLHSTSPRSHVNHVYVRTWSFTFARRHG